MADDSLSQLSKTNLSRLDAFTNSLEGTLEAGKSVEEMLKANQMTASKEKLQDEAEDNSAMGIQIRTKKLDKKKELKTDRAKRAEESVLVRSEDADGLADGFSQRQGNREYRLDSRILSELAEDLGIGIHEKSEPDEMISFVRRRLKVDGQNPDVAIIDKAFEFLLEVARATIVSSIGTAKDRIESIYKNLEMAKFKHFESNAVEIQVAQKIIGAVDAVVETTNQTVKETLDHYREVVHNPPDLQTLRKYFEVKGVKAMMLELKGLNTYLGGNFKRTNLECPEMIQLANMARKMQALFGVFRQSKVHIPTMETYLTMQSVLVH